MVNKTPPRIKYSYNCEHVFTLSRYDKKQHIYRYRCKKCGLPAVSESHVWNENYKHGVTPILEDLEKTAFISQVVIKNLLQSITESGSFEWCSPDGNKWHRFVFDKSATQNQIQTTLDSYKNMGFKIRC